MKPKFSRAQILERLSKRMINGDPIFVANCSAGMIAKYAEKYGADLLTVHSRGKFRYRGLPDPLPCFWWGGTNEIKGNVFEIYHEIENAIDNIPVVAGLEAYDALFRHMDKLISKATSTGYDGIYNYPTWGWYKPLRWLRDAAGFGFTRELEMIKLAHQMDVFTMAIAFWPEDAQEFVKMGADVIIAHCGWEYGFSTGGPEPGSVKFDFDAEGFRAQPKTLDESCRMIQEICDAARSVNPKQIVLAAGGPITTPENAQKVMDRVDVDGFEISHGIDVVPIEIHLRRIGKEYKSLRLNPKNPNVERVVPP